MTRHGNSDHEDWIAGPTHAAPREVERIFERSELRRSVVRLLVWSIGIIGGCGFLVWKILH